MAHCTLVFCEGLCCHVELFTVTGTTNIVISTMEVMLSVEN